MMGSLSSDHVQAVSVAMISHCQLCESSHKYPGSSRIATMIDLPIGLGAQRWASLTPS